MKFAAATIPSWLAALGKFDPDEIDRLTARWEAAGRPHTLAEFQGGPAPTTKRPARKVAAPKPAPTQPAETVAVRGPWLLSIDGLGRPPTANAERTSSMSRGSMAKVRQIKRDWDAAVADAAKAAGIPHLGRAFVTVQPYYPNNIVPDPDGLFPVFKATLDGLVMAGVLDNDRREQLPFGFHPLPPYTDGGPPRVAIVVYPLA